MNLYLDSSALIKRFLIEDGSDLMQDALVQSKTRTTSRITYVETMRGISANPRLARRSRATWSSIDFVEVGAPVCERAVAVSLERSLKSLDAIHLASALLVNGGDLTFATWDRRLHAAARAEGLGVLPPSLD